MRNDRAGPRERGYTSRWDKARKAFLGEHPWCARCALQGAKVEATVVDHIKAHRGDSKLFWDRKNWQPLCQTHHNSTKQREEHRGHMIGNDVSGRPLDPSHPWNRNRV